MRSIALILLAVTLASALDLSRFASLVQTGTRDNEAVESVYNLLRDLKTENVQIQVQADNKNITDEDIGAKVIGDLTNVANINKNNWNNAKAYRESIEKQLLEAINWVNWANNRLAEIARRSEALSDQRCFANGLFVKAIKDHQDALEVVKLLKQDLSGYLTNQPSSLAEVATNVADRLSMYSHIFQTDAIKQFTQLASSTNEKAQGDTNAEQVYNLLVSLEEQLNANLLNLQTEEINAAFALAKWLSDSGAEVTHLETEIARKETQIEKLTIAQPAAIAAQAKVNSIWKDSVDAVNGAIADLEEKRDYYAAETARRAEENSIIDQVISIFKEQVRDLVSGTSLGKKK